MRIASSIERPSASSAATIRIQEAAFSGSQRLTEAELFETSEAHELSHVHVDSKHESHGSMGTWLTVGSGTSGNLISEQRIPWIPSRPSKLLAQPMERVVATPASAVFVGGASSMSATTASTARKMRAARGIFAKNRGAWARGGNA